MNRGNIVLIGILIVLIVTGGFLLWDWALGATEDASTPIAAIPLEVEAANSGGIPGSGELNSAVSDEATQAEVDIAPAETSGISDSVVYQIIPLDSEARFTIYEELRGQPKEVIGVSEQIAGEIALDLNDLRTVQLGVVQVNARALVTDDDRRNQAIRNRILNTDNYEYITFTPVQIIGLQGGASPGQNFAFQVTGDLTIRDTIAPVVFEVRAQVESENRITGSATTTIQRGDFNLAVPSVPMVANVGEDVTIEIDFVVDMNSATG